MSLTLLSELVKLREETPNWKRQALEFQQLMLDNPWIEDLDVSIEHSEDQDSEHYDVHVKHPEFMNITFHVDDHFSVSHALADENYGDTAKEAYEAAMPVLIGLKAGYALQEKSSSFNDFVIEVGPGTQPDDHTTSCVRMNHSGTGDDAYFSWDIKRQGYEPIDEEQLPKGHGILFKTIQGMADYLDSFSR